MLDEADIDPKSSDKIEKPLLCSKARDLSFFLSNTSQLEELSDHNCLNTKDHEHQRHVARVYDC